MNYLPDSETVIFRAGPVTKMDALIRVDRSHSRLTDSSSYRTIAWSVRVKGAPELVVATETTG
jgi:uncharacterized protein